MKTARRKEVLGRFFVLGVTAAASLGAWLILRTLPSDEQSRVEALVPKVFLVGLGLGLAIWLVDRWRPDITGRVSTQSWVWYGVLGLLMFLGERVIILAAVGMAGMVVPFMFTRFRLS